MRDIETVYKGYKICHDAYIKCQECPYYDGAGTMTKCTEMETDVLRILEQMAAMPAPRVLPLDEVMETAGSGWCEDWWPADPEDDTPEEHSLRQVGWCRGNVIDDSGSTSGPGHLRDKYLEKYGFRIWSTKPTEAEMEAAPWTK